MSWSRGSCGKSLPVAVAVDRLELPDELREVVGREIDVVLRRRARSLSCASSCSKRCAVDPVDDLAVHLDEPAVRVVREARIAGRAAERLDRLRVEPEVEDRVHHPGHRDRRARAHRDEQRVVGIAEAACPSAPRGGRRARRSRRSSPSGKLRRPHVLDAGLGRHGEPGGHGNPERGHLREPGSLAAERARRPAPAASA